MKEKIAQLHSDFIHELASAKTEGELELLKVKYLGKKGPVQGLMPFLREATQAERPHLGGAINDLKQEITKVLDAALEKASNFELNDRLRHEVLDVTLPGRKQRVGKKHIVSQIIEEVAKIHESMGFTSVSSPEIESEYYNYGGLNYPEDHPARDMQDTYYIAKDVLLRSHTTSFQQRIMEAYEPPLRVVNIGKCYRNETISSRSHVLFHQFDGLYIDKNVTFADLIATMKDLYSRFFNEDVKIRVRNSYFPFVEPGMEVDVFCTSCKGSGCRLCKQTGWLEVCGAGMVHPEVIKAGGLDPDVYSGYAWGGGIERLILLRHHVSDIRLFQENDMRFLESF